MPLRRIYTGTGERQPDVKLPPVDPQRLRTPEDYLAPPDLAAAVDVALTLGMPLLITGEPGSGKSSLADAVAHELGLGRALRFVVKSDTEARDLFYRFDTVGRFHASQTRDADVNAANFISFAALGEAILRAKPRRFAETYLGLPGHLLEELGDPTRSVVLIDEIDKAPRDVPNDILVEIETMEFTIPELSGSDGRGEVRVGLRDDAGRHENRYRPIVIFTSNQEKALPEPFLRRCVFFHLNLPPFDPPPGTTGAVTITSIVQRRLGDRYTKHSEAMDLAIDFFRYLREDHPGLERPPVLSELLNWLDYLSQVDPLIGNLRNGEAGEARQALLHSIDTLLLKRAMDRRRDADSQREADILGDWRRHRADNNRAR